VIGPGSFGFQLLGSFAPPGSFGRVRLVSFDCCVAGFVRRGSQPGSFAPRILLLGWFVPPGSFGGGVELRHGRVRSAANGWGCLDPPALPGSFALLIRRCRGVPLLRWVRLDFPAPPGSFVSLSSARRACGRIGVALRRPSGGRRAIDRRAPRTSPDHLCTSAVACRRNGQRSVAPMTSVAESRKKFQRWESCSGYRCSFSDRPLLPFDAGVVNRWLIIYPMRSACALGSTAGPDVASLTPAAGRPRGGRARRVAC
jgi:hypothetical protein